MTDITTGRFSMTPQLEADAARLRVARRAAARCVASNSTDAVDCSTLLSVLGIEPGEGKTDREVALPDTLRNLRGTDELRRWNDPPSQGPNNARLTRRAH